MPLYVLSPAAETDVTEIAAYIEEDNPIAAKRLVEEFFDTFERLAKRPAMGHRRPDLTPLSVLFWPVRRSHLIIYRPGSEAIEIVRVLNARRDLIDILAKAAN